MDEDAHWAMTQDGEFAHRMLALTGGPQYHKKRKSYDYEVY